MKQLHKDGSRAVDELARMAMKKVPQWVKTVWEAEAAEEAKAAKAAEEAKAAPKPGTIRAFFTMLS